MCKLRIKDLREDHDKTQQEIADLLNTTHQQYSKYERQVQEIPTRHICKLAEYYNVSTDYILGKTKDPTPPKEREQEKQEQKKYSPAVMKAAEDIRASFQRAKGREPNQEDLQKIVKTIETIIQNFNN